MTRSWQRSAVLRFLDRGGGRRDEPGADLFDAPYVERVIERVERLFGDGRPFAVDVRGWDNLPKAPVLVVSNHSGGSSVPDAWGFFYAWYTHFGAGRPIRALAHEMILATRVTRRFFGRCGVLPASPEHAARALQQWRHDVFVMPGGDRDTWRAFSRRYEAEFAGHLGYARLALRAGVSIVPVANAGAHETLIVLSEGRGIARRLHLHDLARIDVFPIHLSLPWGIGIGPWPHIPFPRPLRYRIGPAIRPTQACAPGEDPTEDHVHRLDRRVRAAMKRLLSQLQHDRARSERKASSRLQS